MMYIDHLPYWIVNGEKFQDHFLAYTRAEESGHSVEGYFFEDIFDRHDWTIEPSESFDSLMQRRAIQLRETYRYIRLWYSGGADSQTMLEVFIENNIPIDEIVMVRSSPSGDFEDFANSEITKVAIPYIEFIRKQIPNTKVSLFDAGPKQFEKLYLHSELRHRSYYMFRPTTLAPMQVMYPDFFEKLGDRGYLCDLHGGDKPKVDLRDNGEFISYYWDVQHGLHNFESVEQFYVSPDLPELHIKQCHLLKNYLKAHLPEEVPIQSTHDFQSKWFYEINNSCRRPLFVNWSVGKEKNTIQKKGRQAVEQARLHLPRVYEKFMSDFKAEDSWQPERFNPGGLRKGIRCQKTKEYSLGR